MFIQFFDRVHSDPFRNIKSSLTEEQIDFLKKVAKANRNSLDLEIQRLKVYLANEVAFTYDEIVETTSAPILEDVFFGLPIILN